MAFLAIRAAAATTANYVASRVAMLDAPLAALDFTITSGGGDSGNVEFTISYLETPTGNPFDEVTSELRDSGIIVHNVATHRIAYSGAATIRRAIPFLIGHPYIRVQVRHVITAGNPPTVGVSCLGRELAT